MTVTRRGSKTPFWNNWSNCFVASSTIYCIRYWGCYQFDEISLISRK